MKIKNIILIFIVTVLMVILLQGNVKAGNVAEFVSSEYDYFLTESNKVLSKTELSDTANAEEEIIVCIEGEYTGTIEKLSTGEVKISNFNADAIRFLTSDFDLWIDGENKITTMVGGCIEVNAESDGKLTYDIESSPNDLYIDNEGCYLSGEVYEETMTWFFGDYIMKVDYCDYISVNYHGLVAEEWDTLEALIKPNSYIAVKNLMSGTVIPESIFEKLYKQPYSEIDFIGEGFSLGFRSELGTTGFINRTSFTPGVEISETPEWNMVDTKIEDVLYINFEHSGELPGPVCITGWYWGFEEGDILKCYYFNEETRLYERVKDASYGADNEIFMNIDHCSKYVLTENELPADLVANDDANYGSGEGEPEDKEPEAPKNEEEDKKEDIKKEENKKEDTTTASGNVPYAGGATVVIISVLALIIVAGILHIKNKDLREI